MLTWYECLQLFHSGLCLGLVPGCHNHLTALAGQSTRCVKPCTRKQGSHRQTQTLSARVQYNPETCTGQALSCVPSPVAAPVTMAVLPTPSQWATTWSLQMQRSALSVAGHGFSRAKSQTTVAHPPAASICHPMAVSLLPQTWWRTRQSQRGLSI